VIRLETYLVTGGMGFIGSDYVRYLLDEFPRRHVIVLDKLTYAGNPDNLAKHKNNDRMEFVRGDICDKGVVEILVQRADVVVNFAAETHVDRSILYADDFLQTDVFGTFVLLEAARKGEIKRFLQVSTDEVYGEVPLGNSSREDDPLMPRNPYSASKSGADRLAFAYHETYGVPVSITRGSNTYGPHQYPEKLIPLFITNLMEDKKVPLYGDGTNIRDWLFVRDHCRGIETVIQRGKTGEVYNVGGGEELQNIEVTKTILELMGKDETSIQYVEDRPGHDRRYSMETKKLKQLGWKPETDFATGLPKTIEWYKENKPWWEPIKSGEFRKYYDEQYGKRGME